MTSRWFHAAGLAIAALLALNPAAAASSDEVLTNAADILSLTAAQAHHKIKVSITGVVTVAEVSPNWKGKFFVQDATGGVFVNNTNKLQPLVGDLVQVDGESHPGGYAPDITQPVWKKLGTAPLPPARPVSAERLMSGLEDGQRVEVSGVVRFAQRGATKLLLELASGGYRFRAFVPVSINIDPGTLVGATVRLRGTAATSFNASLRHILTVGMYVTQNSDFIVDQPADNTILQQPFTPLDGIAQYRSSGSPGGRIRVKGVVTYQRPGEDIFLHDATGGLQVEYRETSHFAPGEVVEAVGFPDLSHFLPVLQDATLIRTTESREIISPAIVSLQQLSDGLHHADPVILQGRLLDRSVRHTSSPTAHPGHLKSIIILQNSNFIFTAEAASAEGFTELASIPIGSMLEVSGVCLLQLDEEGKIETVQILLPGADNVRIIKMPGWWTPNRLLTGLTALLSILLVALIWSAMILRKNSALRASISEKVNAQQELQKAHDLLEWRVQERTKQLKFEMTARKESEVQFKATLIERTRLAQELHDTLEQSLTGIGLQLDTAGRLSGKEPERAVHHVELARSMMTQSQIELRRSIWDLRSRELEEFDLCSALLASGQQMLDGTDIQIRVTTEGMVRPLSEVMEENLLRIGQEALTNVIKHSSATLVTFELKFNAQSVILKITDNGRGFNPENSVGASEGHFGLVGIHERTKRLDGRLTITSAPGAGTVLAVEIPINHIPVGQPLMNPPPLA
ncbi:MAG: integral rane sensor signal transduction histidine kinase [Pedosphaera sp.]|nr:integral rane sensor signal transduction histidine kinase [Pedosphaera sp.]